jgi:hypothetical protein
MENQNKTQIIYNKMKNWIDVETQIVRWNALRYFNIGCYLQFM